MSSAGPSGQQAWRDWAEALGGEQAADAVAGAAIAALEAGATPEEAAAAARIAAGRPEPADRPRLETRLAQLAAARSEVAKLPPMPGSDAVTAALAARSAVFEEAVGNRQIAAGPAALPVPVAVPGPSVREFLAERSIQLLAYSGAFLLAVATLLFDLSGSSPSRFAAVLGLCLAFAAGAAFAAQRPSLRPIAPAYVAMTALLLPLVVLAAYVFLDLGARGLTATAAAAIGAGLCAASYMILGAVVRSAGYATLSLLALAVCVGASGVAAGWEAWTGVALNGVGSVLMAAWVSRRLPRPFAVPAAGLAYALQPVGVAWALTADFTGGEPRPEAAWALWLAAAAVAAGALRTPATLFLAGLLAPLALAASLGAYHAPDSSSHPAFLFMGGTLALAGTAPARARLGAACSLLMGASGALLMLAAVWPSSEPALEAAMLALVTVAFATGLTLYSRAPIWLTLATAGFGLGWYSASQAVLPFPHEAAIADLGAVMAPVPLILGVVSVAVRLRLSRRFAIPVYLSAGTSAVAVTTLLMTGRPGLSALVIAVYSTLAFGVAALERARALAAAAVIGGAIAVALGLDAANRATDDYLLAIGLYGTMVWLTSLTPAARLKAVAPASRLAGIGLLLLATTAALGIGPPWVLLCGSVLSAAVLAADARIHGFPAGEYLAVLVLSLAGTALAGLLALDDAQFRVAPTGIAFLLAATRLAGDARFTGRLLLARLGSLAGVLLLLGLSAWQAAGELSGGPDGMRVGWLAVESTTLLLAGVGTRSRVLVIGAAVGLAWAAMLGVTLLSQVVPLSIVFFLVAITLILGATGLAILRGRLGLAADTARDQWSRWL